MIFCAQNFDYKVSGTTHYLDRKPGTFLRPILPRTNLEIAGGLSIPMLRLNSFASSTSLCLSPPTDLTEL